MSPWGKRRVYLMAVPVMQIGIVRMPVTQAPVLVRMGMRLAPVPAPLMLVLVMQVMHVFVRVRRRFVLMLVLVPLGEVQPYPKTHQGRSRPKRHAGALAE